jgi:hypothetical protein
MDAPLCIDDYDNRSTPAPQSGQQTWMLWPAQISKSIPLAMFSVAAKVR